MGFNKTCSKEQAVYDTVYYHNIFNYPLKQKEAWRFLITKPCFKNQTKLSLLKVNQTLKKLEKKQKLSQKGQYYFLPQKDNLVILRKKRKQYSQEKIKIAQKTAQVLQFIPFIKMIAVTGGLAMSNAKKNDDIDFLIISQEGRLWLTRLITVVILEILGRRRRPADKVISNKICLNMFLDQTALSLPSQKRNLYTAHEIAQLKLIYDRHKTYNLFLLKNQWIKSFLPNSFSNRFSAKPMKNNIRKNKQNFFKPLKLAVNYALDFLERLAFFWQIKYMKKRKTREQTAFHFAFFHPKNRGQQILKKYGQKKPI